MRALVLASLLTIVASPAYAEGERFTQPLATGWNFQKVEAKNPEELAARAATWSEVAVPHSWNRVGYYLPDPASHINRAETVDNYQGVGWYRLRFTPTASLKGKKVFLQFDAASRTAEAWLNGRPLGGHRGGFSRFRLDATAALRPGVENVLLVKVDNTKPSLGSSTADVLPLAGDFFVHGGLYRPVSLVATDPVHVDMLDSGGPGVFARTRVLTTEKATVDVRVRLRNDASKSQAVGARIMLVDAAGRTVAEATRSIPLPMVVRGKWRHRSM